MNNLQEQLEHAVRDYGNDINTKFSNELVTKIANYIKKDYEVDSLTQEELDDFIDSDAIGESVMHFWNDYLNE